MKSIVPLLTAGMLTAAMSTTGIAKNGGVGIYAIVDKVALEPDTTSPERLIHRLTRTVSSPKGPPRNYFGLT